MKRVFIIAILLVSHFCGNVSAQSLRELFVKMHVRLLPLLKGNDRLDLIDLYDANYSTSIINSLDGKSRLKVLTKDYLQLSVTASSSMQMKMLPTQDGDTLLCVVNTVAAEASDSRIRFYGKDWQPLDGVFFDAPAIADFFLPSDSAVQVMDIADIYLVELRLSPDDKTLVAEYTLPHYMTKEDAERVMPHMRKMTYEWDGRKFQRVD